MQVCQEKEYGDHTDINVPALLSRDRNVHNIFRNMAVSFRSVILALDEQWEGVAAE